MYPSINTDSKTALQVALRRIFLSLVMLGTCLTANAHADTLTHLRTTLKGLNSHAAIKGVLDDSVASLVMAGTVPASRPLASATTIPFSAAVLRSSACP